MPAKHILVPIDFEEPSTRALEGAVELALGLGAALTLVHVVQLPSYAYFGDLYSAYDCLTPLSEAAQVQLDACLATVQARVPKATALLKTGVAWQEILAAAAECGADLIVIGTHGRQGLPRALLGSVAERIVRLSPAPVLTVHAS